MGDDICRQAYRWLAANNPSAFGNSVSAETLAGLEITPARRMDIVSDRDITVFGGALDTASPFWASDGEYDDGAATIDLLSESLGGLGAMIAAINAEAASENGGFLPGGLLSVDEEGVALDKLRRLLVSTWKA